MQDGEAEPPIRWMQNEPAIEQFLPSGKVLASRVGRVFEAPLDIPHQGY